MLPLAANRWFKGELRSSQYAMISIFLESGMRKVWR